MLSSGRMIQNRNLTHSPEAVSPFWFPENNMKRWTAVRWKFTTWKHSSSIWKKISLFSLLLAFTLDKKTLTTTNIWLLTSVWQGTTGIHSHSRLCSSNRSLSTPFPTAVMETQVSITQIFASFPAQSYDARWSSRCWRLNSFPFV